MEALEYLGSTGGVDRIEVFERASRAVEEWCPFLGSILYFVLDEIHFLVVITDASPFPEKQRLAQKNATKSVAGREQYVIRIGGESVRVDDRGGGEHPVVLVR